MDALLGIFALFALLVIGAPVALALLMSGALGLWLVGGSQLLVGILGTTAGSSIQGYEFATVPMFILMANFIISSRVSDDMFNIARVWMGRTPGGLAHATALTGAAFGAISGSSTAAAATLSATSIPGMLKQGYSPKLATGVAAISGTLSMLIPPSVAMIIYALLAELSVGRMLIAGVIPGILVSLTILATVAFLVWRNPEHAPAGERYTLREKIVATKSAWSFIFLFLMVTGVIYTGIATPTEASAFGAVGALFLAVLRRTPAKELIRAGVTTAQATCMIGFIIIGALVFGYFLTLSQVTQTIIDTLVNSGIPHIGIIIMLVFIYLILGCFMDIIAMLILTVPVVYPLILQLGYDPIWFAVVTIVMGEVGMVTPPLGMNAFVIAKYTNIPVGQIFEGSIPHVIAHLIAVALLIAFPELVLWLPNTMDG
ncbi:tripartite ATP-independent transporter DctM subunit [Limimaricola variabilis]|uniref:TRAP transporter large permease protein n=1 Tax=Limimaricola variabilis TaxID=1492771 RepID=A0ABR6HRI5_9RHOB|nr:TRAP transporter large permease subunit [Limimaricola variabilis]MBB3713082.1 tripartite ATP-independent transporter DctM subunit [Limimaricola variabilis]